jgi:hypothetical protein
MYTQIYMYIICPKYNFNTYIKIHPYVTVKYVWDVIHLVTIQLMGHIKLSMDENKLKIHPTNRMKFSIVAS